MIKPSLSTQQCLIKWLLKVNNILEDSTVLSKSYSVLFNLLDTLSLRVDLCYLLSRVTRKKHVKPFRLQMLQNLSRKSGNEPALLKLMSVYDDYAPGLLDMGKSRKGVSGFPHSDSEWGDRLEQIRSRTRPHSASNGVEKHSDDSLGFPSQKKTNGTSQRLDPMDESVDDLSKPLSSKLSISDLQKPAWIKRAALDPGKEILAAIDELLSTHLHQHLEKMQRGHHERRGISDVLEKALALTIYIKV